VREVLAALRDWSVVRWLVLLEVADLLVDVLTGFLALYLVDVAHLRPETAVLAVAVRLGAGLAGDAGLVFVLERVPDVIVLRASAAVAAVAYPGFLLVPGAPAKLAVLAVLSAATAPWYPLLQARLYGSLPGRSPVAVTLSSAAGLAGGLGPLAVGLIAGTFGLSWALGVLVGVPLVVLAGSVRPARRNAAAGERAAGDEPAAGERAAPDESPASPEELGGEQRGGE
jgi:FSR family fosmidomycin resistance protein-like MFS transporter